MNRNRYQIVDYYCYEEVKSNKPITHKERVKLSEAKEQWSKNLDKIITIYDKVEGKGLYDTDPYTSDYKRQLGYDLRDLKEEQGLLDSYIQKLNKKLI